MMAKALVDGGASKVYIVGRRVDVLQSAAAQLNKPSVVVPLYCDVTSKISLESIVSVVETDSGFLNLLVCNAGIGGPQASPPPFISTTTTGSSGSIITSTEVSSLDDFRNAQLATDFDEFNNTFRVNATSVWFTAMAFLKLLDNGNKRQNLGMGAQSSQVVVTSSIAGFNKTAPGGFAYGASKAAATHLAKTLSRVLPSWGIRYVSLKFLLFPFYF